MEIEKFFESQLSTSQIFKEKKYLYPNYIPSELPFREKQIENISKNVAQVLKNSRPNNFFLYGKTGTGKTATAKFVLNKFYEFLNKKTLNVSFGNAYINCRMHNSKYKVFLKILSSLIPNENYLGFSFGFVYEKVLSKIEEEKKHVVVVLDEIDLVKDVDDLLYVLSRCNDELSNGSLSFIGISNNIMFKEKLDARTKSTLFEKQEVFPPYNAEELREILSRRVKLAFQENVVEESAINLASAISAQETGDARLAVLLLLRAGEIAEENKKERVTDKDVLTAKKKVEEELISELVSTLPLHQKAALFALTSLTKENKGINRFGENANIFFSGEVYEKYVEIIENYGKNPVTLRWFKEYIDELETYGLIYTTPSSKGVRGNTTLIKLAVNENLLEKILGKEFKTKRA